MQVQVKSKGSVKWSDSGTEVETLVPEASGKAIYQKHRIFMSLSSGGSHVRQEQSGVEEWRDEQEGALNEKQEAGDPVLIVPEGSTQDSMGHVMLPAAGSSIVAGKVAETQWSPQWSPKQESFAADTDIVKSALQGEFRSSSSAGKRTLGLVSFDMTESAPSEVDQPIKLLARGPSADHGHVNVVLEVVEAKDLESARMFGGCDSFVVIEVDDKVCRVLAHQSRIFLGDSLEALHSIQVVEYQTRMHRSSIPCRMCPSTKVRFCVRHIDC